MVLFVVVPVEREPHSHAAHLQPVSPALLLLEHLLRVLHRPSPHITHLHHCNHDPQEQVDSGFEKDHADPKDEGYHHGQGLKGAGGEVPEPVIGHLHQHVQPHCSRPRIQAEAPSSEQVLHSIQSQPYKLEVYADPIVLVERDRGGILSLLKDIPMTTKEQITRGKVSRMQRVRMMLGSTKPQIKVRYTLYFKIVY